MAKQLRTRGVNWPCLSQDAGTSCVPGSEWFSECSHCHCPASGQNPICEHVGCPVCKMGHRWNMNCNPCFCLRGGHSICRMMSSHNCDVAVGQVCVCACACVCVYVLVHVCLCRSASFICVPCVYRYIMKM